MSLLTLGYQIGLMNFKVTFGQQVDTLIYSCLD
jgi:hypothetical protein